MTSPYYDPTELVLPRRTGPADPVQQLWAKVARRVMDATGNETEAKREADTAIALAKKGAA
jgi:hypothetical protein